MVIDRKVPSITINSLTNAAYTLNQVVAASYTCVDGGSHIASCAGLGPNSANIDTVSVWSKMFTVQSADNVGNSASTSVFYQVVYNFRGFFHPIDSSLPNSAKAGQIIPIKWRLTDANGQPSATRTPL